MPKTSNPWMSTWSHPKNILFFLAEAVSAGGLFHVRSSLRCRLLADSVEKVFFDWRTKFFRTADAFRTRRLEGPHPFTQKRPRTSVSALQSFGAVETPKNRPSQHFRSRSIFDFCNNICQYRMCQSPIHCRRDQFFRDQRRFWSS